MFLGALFFIPCFLFRVGKIYQAMLMAFGCTAGSEQRITLLVLPDALCQWLYGTKDTRVVFGDYAYGGTTVLSLVKIDEPAVANRTEIGK